MLLWVHWLLLTPLLSGWCLIHTVEVAGSNPAAPTIPDRLSFGQGVLRPLGRTQDFGSRLGRRESASSSNPAAPTTIAWSSRSCMEQPLALCSHTGPRAYRHIRIGSVPVFGQYLCNAKTNAGPSTRFGVRSTPNLAQDDHPVACKVSSFARRYMSIRPSRAFNLSRSLEQGIFLLRHFRDQA